MGKPSRDKGKRGENDVVEIFRDAGAKGAKRTAVLQAGTRHFGVEADADVWVADGLHIEVKRQETLRISEWLRQLDRDCPGGAEGILAYRRSREPWCAVVRRQFLCDLEDRLDRTAVIKPPMSATIVNLDRVTVDLVGLAQWIVDAGMTA